MIRCRMARRLTNSAMERELSLEQRFRLDDHTARCPACSEHQRRSLGLQEWLEGPGDPPPSEPDVDGAVRAVFSALDRGEGRPWRPSPRRRTVAAVLGVLTLAAGFFFVLMQSSRENTEPLPTELVLPVSISGAVAAPGPEEPTWDTASVEALVRATLLDCFGSPGADRARASQDFLEGTREPARSGWPLRRFVEGLLESPDPKVALAAVRYLASTGEGSAAPVLERVLERREIAEGVLDALGSLGVHAVPVLERSLAKADLAPRVLLQLGRIGGQRAAEVIERSALYARKMSTPSREALLDALATTGPDAVASLLRLAANSERDECAAILARLSLVEDAGPALARVVEEERLPDDLAYRALDLLRPYEALPWLEERCGNYRVRGRALETLANYPGTGPLDSALRLAETGRASRDGLLTLLVDLLERDEDRAETFSRQLVLEGQPARIQPWLTLLIESGHPGAGRGLVPLVFCEALGSDDRLLAALAIGEMGTVNDGEVLVRELVLSSGSDRKCLGACVLSIYRLLGADAVAGLFEACSSGNVGRILGALESSGRPGEAVRIHRVARALDGALAELARASEEKKDVL